VTVALRAVAGALNQVERSDTCGRFNSAGNNAVAREWPRTNSDEKAEREIIHQSLMTALAEG
jgi:hypothetical protein